MRMIALGGAALTQGFGLLGFEIFADPSSEQVEGVLSELMRREDHALVVLEHGLIREPGPYLRRLRQEGGRVVVAEVPSFHAPSEYHPPVEELVRRVLGPNALEG